MDKEKLLTLLQINLDEILEQIRIVARDTENYSHYWNGRTLSVYEAKTSDQKYIMQPLLLAKAEVLSAMARLI